MTMRISFVSLLKIGFLILFVLLYHKQIVIYAQSATSTGTQKQYYFEGDIVKVQKTKNGKEAIIKAKNGPKKDNKVIVPLMTGERARAQSFKEGDKVVLLSTTTPGQPELIYIVDFVRTGAITLLFALFTIVVIVIGRWHGILSILSMVYSFLIIGQFIIPNIASGNDPVFVSLLGGILISPVTFYLSHGFNKKTSVAVGGTVASLLFTGILSVLFVNLTQLTGVTSDEALFVQNMINQNINLKNLLLAGMIIGLLGILDDITVSQAAIVEKLIQTGEKLNNREVFFHAMDVGKDHIASLVNTLVLVYAGASLPLFLLFYNSGLPFSNAVSSEIVATEIVRTLTGSIGLVTAVPITTLLACIVMKRK